MILFFDLRRQYADLGAEVEAAVSRVLQSGQYVLGDEVSRFEQEFAAYCGARHAVGVNSGTSALHLALLAAGVGPGDEVITVPFTFVATAAVIRYAGARPVFVDIDPTSYTMDVARLTAAIGPRTKAILPVHLYGQPADMEPILACARRHGLRVIEDAAQAHGAEYRGARVGSLGDLGCFSFYPSKNLGACGEGGIVVTNDADMARQVRILRDWGQAQKYQHVCLGYNYRMEAVQAAVLRVKLRHLEAWTERRRDLAGFYDRALGGGPVSPPSRGEGSRHVFHLYVVRSPRRRALQDQLTASGVGTGIHYPTPVHLQAAFQDLGHRRGEFPASEMCADSVLSLPMFPELRLDEARQVVEAIRAFKG